MPLAQLVMNLLAELPGDTHVHIPGAQVRQQRMVAQRQHDHIRHRLPDVRLGTGQRETGRRQGVRPALYHTEGFTHAAEPVEPQDQLDDAAALRQGEVVPFVQLVIHLERGHLLFPEGDRYQYWLWRIRTGTWPSDCRKSTIRIRFASDIFMCKECLV